MQHLQKPQFYPYSPGEGRGGGKRTRHLYAFSISLFILALLSKSVVASLPVVILLLIWWKQSRIRRDDIIRLLPFFILGAAMGAITSYMETHHVGAAGPEYDFSPLQRTIIASRALWFYLCKLLWPTNITFTYPKWNLDVSTRPHLLLFPISIVTAFITLYLLRPRITRGPFIAFLMFAAILFPALGFANFFPMRYSFVADHFQYLACIPILALIVMVADRALPRTILITAAALVIPILMIQTYRQVKIYRDPQTLWLDTIAKNPTSFMPHSNLADWYKSHGNLPAAEQEYLLSIEFNPNDFSALRNLGNINYQRGNYTQALKWDQRALDSIPKIYAPNFQPYFIQGAIYTEMASIQSHLGDTQAAQFDNEKSLDAYHKAIDQHPEDIDALTNLGDLLTNDGHIFAAIILYQKALALDPNSIPAHTNLGNALLAAGHIPAAITEYKTVLQLQPDNANAHNNLGTIYARQAQWPEAIAEFQAALNADPNFELARQNLDRAKKMGQP